MTQGTGTSGPKQAAAIFGGGGEATPQAPEGSATKGAAETPNVGDAIVLQRVLAVLVASTAPLSMDALSADINGGGNPHIAQGRIEAILGVMGESVAKTTGEGGVVLYALTPSAREEIDAPGRAMEARAAVALVLGGAMSYLDLETGGDVKPVSYLPAADIAHAIVRANSVKGPLLDEDLQRSFVGEENAETPAGMEALIARARGAADLLVQHELAAYDADADGFELTEEGERKLATAGAIAVMKAMMPASAAPSQDEVVAELTTTWERTLKEGEAARKAAIAQRDKALAETALYERWFSEKGIESPAKLVAEQLRATTSEKVFTWKQQVTIEGDELFRLIDEMRELDALIEQREEAIKSNKKASEAALDILRARRSTVYEAVTNRGSRTIVKNAFSRVVTVDGVPMREVCSAEEHDYGTVLATEPLALGTQLGIPGAAAPSTPVAALPSVEVKPAPEASDAAGSVKTKRTTSAAPSAALPAGDDTAEKTGDLAAGKATLGDLAKITDAAAPAGPALKALTPASIRSYVVDHILPAHPNGILLSDIPKAIVAMAGMTFTSDEARATTLTTLEKGAQSARIKGLVAEDITPKGPVYRALPKPEEKGDEEGKKGKGKASGKADAGK